jgi:SAM-dependent methyltransferase
MYPFVPEDSMSPFNPKKIFGPRVEAYVHYRPGYPADVLNPLVKECGLNPDWHVADIGSGTGLLARLFLDFGCAVSGVEPNEEMRLAGEQILADYPNFTSLPGSAEATGLADGSVGLVCAGMAFHWFDIPRAKEEFRRILTPAGWVALVWNRMLAGPDAFMRDYTGVILETCPAWTETQRRDLPGSSLDLPGFFGGKYRRAACPNQQVLDWDGLRGRTLSIAHVPQPDDPAHGPMFTQLGEIFDRYQSSGKVVVPYETEVYYGRI